MSFALQLVLACLSAQLSATAPQVGMFADSKYRDHKMKNHSNDFLQLSKL